MCLVVGIYLVENFLFSVKINVFTILFFIMKIEKKEIFCDKSSASPDPQSPTLPFFFFSRRRLAATRDRRRLFSVLSCYSNLGILLPLSLLCKSDLCVSSRFHSF